jgi:hypothetical protein
MSSVTSMFAIIGDSEDGLAEDVAPKVAEAIAEFVVELSGNIPVPPVISVNRDGWDTLQGGIKPGGGAVIWFSWNFARPVELEAHLKERGFTHITLWSQHEFEGPDGIAPRVASW